MGMTQLMSTEARGLHDDDDDGDETLECGKNTLWSSPTGFPIHTTASSDLLPIANLIFIFARGVPGSRCEVKFGAGSLRDCTSRVCGEGMGPLGYWACPVHVASPLKGLVPRTLLIELKEIPTQATLVRSFGGRGTPLRARSPQTHTLAESLSTEHTASHFNFVTFHLPSRAQPQGLITRIFVRCLVLQSPSIDTSYCL